MLSDPQTWTSVDFWQEQKTEQNWTTKGRNVPWISKYGNTTWIFPFDENDVLHFLKKYTCGSLKFLYLHVASKNIIAHVNQTYWNLETICFNSPKFPLYNEWPPTYTAPHDHVFLLPVVQSLRDVHYPLGHFSCDKCFEKQQNNLFLFLRKCKDLRR